MQTGRVEANLPRLNESARLPYIDDLMAYKLAGPEKGRISQADLALYEREYERLCGDMRAASDASSLPEVPHGADALHDLLICLRFNANEKSPIN